MELADLNGDSSESRYQPRQGQTHVLRYADDETLPEGVYTAFEIINADGEGLVYRLEVHSDLAHAFLQRELWEGAPPNNTRIMESYPNVGQFQTVRADAYDHAQQWAKRHDITHLRDITGYPESPLFDPSASLPHFED